VQIAKAGTLRAKADTDSGLKRDLSNHRLLPLVLIATAMLSYLVIVWQL
jgi:hypothetical protein